MFNVKLELRQIAVTNQGFRLFCYGDLDFLDYTILFHFLHKTQLNAYHF